MTIVIDVPQGYMPYNERTNDEHFSFEPVMERVSNDAFLTAVLGNPRVFTSPAGTSPPSGG